MISDSASTPLGQSIQACPNRVRAMFAGHVIADSDDVLVLRQAGRRAMHFFPMEEVETGYLGETRDGLNDLQLGPGRCYTWVMAGEIIERAVCVFDDPPLGAEPLAGRLCLSQDVFEVYELTPRDLAAAPRAPHAHG
ncbi:MAG TPA: DUF427 domain-containing protein [Caulobacteraceae bacterium]|jgi:uncharacterized protein (DUF427 family)